MFKPDYNGSNSFLVNATQIYQYKAKISEIKPYPLCLENTSKNVFVNSTKKKKKNRIKWVCVQFFVNYRLLILLILAIFISV